MATKLKEVDVVVVGLGWTGGILSKELAEAGLKVVALERGGMRSTANDYSLPGRARRAALRAPPRPHAEHAARHADDPQQPEAGSAADAAARLVPARRGRRRLGRALERAHLALDATWSSRCAPSTRSATGRTTFPTDMTIQDWGITYAELEPYYDKFEYTAGGVGQGGKHHGQDTAGRQPVRSAARPRLPAAAAHDDTGEPDVRRGREEPGLQPVPASERERVARLHQSGRIEVRRVPVLRLLPALRLRGQREGQRAHDGDSDRDAQPELRAAHPLVGDEGAEGRASASPASPTRTC